jgi:hypothetical protein
MSRGTNCRFRNGQTILVVADTFDRQPYEIYSRKSNPQKETGRRRISRGSALWEESGCSPSDPAKRLAEESKQFETISHQEIESFTAVTAVSRLAPRRSRSIL